MVNVTTAAPVPVPTGRSAACRAVTLRLFAAQVGTMPPVEPPAVDAEAVTGAEARADGDEVPGAEEEDEEDGAEDAVPPPASEPGEAELPAEEPPAAGPVTGAEVPSGEGASVG
ncbi:hypothetical protein GCM10010269_53530 [Streptomyces humidus]|uniref:Uncharacterized protein n=2 Tax=Streptomyces humidus TaxID=52259 RepID=A0A918L5B3_9ACTN|nr:hypothetical protein GCM10010269_53530 [Streptomyces humidus]